MDIWASKTSGNITRETGIERNHCVKFEKYCRIPCSIVRGGTSKGVIINKRHLPDEPALRDAVISDIFGSRSHSQIDGLGGASSLSSKVAIVEASDSPDIDVNYTFGQVGIESNDIDYSINCGNISAAVALFALQENMVPLTKPRTTIKILNTNSSKVIIARITIDFDAINSFSPTTSLDGVSVSLSFSDPVGSKTGRLLPTGQPMNPIKLSNSKIVHVSVIDSGTVYVFVNASQLDVKGYETVTDIEKNEPLLVALEEIKGRVKKLISNIPDSDIINLKIALVSPPQSIADREHGVIDPDDIHISSKIINVKTVHAAYAVTGAVCLSTAILIKGTVVEQMQVGFRENSKKIRIGHPTGVMEAHIDYHCVNENLQVRSININRTARKIMDGFAYPQFNFRENENTT